MRMTAVFALCFTALSARAAEVKEKLYILSSHGDDATVVDTSTNEIITTVKVGKDPHGIACPPSQEVLWIATEGDESVCALDPTTDKVIATYGGFGKRPNELEVTPDGRYLYVPALGIGQYQIFDTKQKKIVKSIPTDGFPHNVVCSLDGRFLYLSPYDRGRSPVEWARENHLPESLCRKVYVVDASRQEVVASVDVPHAPRPIVLSPDGKRLFVNTDDHMGFLVIDTEKRKVIHTVTYDLTEDEKAVVSRSHGIGVTPDGREVWSTDTENGTVHVFDITGDAPRQISKLKSGRIPYWLTFTPDGSTCYASNTAEDTVSVFDVKTKQLKKKIEVGKGKSPKRTLVVRPKYPAAAAGAGK